MKCFNHSDREPASVCPGCGKALCKECASAFAGGLCSDCAFEQSAGSTTGEIVQILIKSALCFAVGAAITYFMQSSSSYKMSTGAFFLSAFVYSGIPWGWSLLSRVIPIAPGGNVAFVVAFYLVKLILSLVVGMFVLLWNIIKIVFFAIKRAVDKKNIEKQKTAMSSYSTVGSEKEE